MRCMAEELCISESYYCSIENGYRQRDMDISLVSKIGKALKMPIKQILKYESDMRSNEPLHEKTAESGPKRGVRL